MKKTLSVYDIANELHSDEFATWTYAGAFALAEWLDDLNEQCGTETEFDRIAIRCDFSEWESLEDWILDYTSSDSVFDACEAQGIETSEDPEELKDAIRDYIGDHGFLIEFEGGVVVSAF